MRQAGRYEGAVGTSTDLSERLYDAFFAMREIARGQVDIRTEKFVERMAKNSA